MAPSPISRLLREQKLLLAEVANGTLKGIAVAPDKRVALKWHFCFSDFDASSDFYNGCYHGIITYPANYPYAPPNIKFITPNGRFIPMASICLSMSDYHPETWNPAWNMVTILLGVRSFMEETNSVAYPGCCADSRDARLAYASQSWRLNAADADFRAMFPQFVKEQPIIEQDDNSSSVCEQCG